MILQQEPNFGLIKHHAKVLNIVAVKKSKKVKREGKFGNWKTISTEHTYC